MRLHFICITALVCIVITACQGPPPTQIYIVVTATPDQGTAEVPSGTSQDVVSETATPTQTATPAATPTIDPFPTPTISEIQVAEQTFEHGHMFWLRPVNQIWVLVADENDTTRGTWTVYDDTWQEGQQEIDPRIQAPAGLFQPERGFGKLWRENPEIRAAMGWALEPEFGYVTGYEYHPGGMVNAQNVYIPEAGYHILYSVLGNTYRFIETDVVGGTQTWELVQ
jgi:hypothetical protein